MIDHGNEGVWGEVEALLAGLAARQEGRVLGLARPREGGLGVSAEVHYEDGLLAGLHVALEAVRARRAELAGAEGR